MFFGRFFSLLAFLLTVCSVSALQSLSITKETVEPINPNFSKLSVLSKRNASKSTPLKERIGILAETLVLSEKELFGLNLTFLVMISLLEVLKLIPSA